jgi:nucleoside-diphosphate-sugar epimerase
LISLNRLIEGAVDRKAKLNSMPMHDGEFYEIYADIDPVHSKPGLEPKTSLAEGIFAWLDWYRNWPKLPRGSFNRTFAPGFAIAPCVPYVYCA